MNQPLLELANIYKSFDGKPILNDISLNMLTGEIVCLLGPSGSGKTTLLRIIAGLESADAGAVCFEGRDLNRAPVHTRGFGLMFQDLALFPHRNVFDNVAFGLRMMRMPRAAIETRVRESLALVGLGEFNQRDVNRLSGGEQQRVALARSLAPRPRLLMFDEPLGALDRLLREQLIADIRAILKRIGMTALYVTHDQAEAMAIADRIAIMHEGQIEQIGTPEEIYDRPASEFVARFLDLGNVLRGRWRDDGSVETAVGRIRIRGQGTGNREQGTPAVTSPSAVSAQGSAAGALHAGDRGQTDVLLLIRPETARVVDQMAENVIEGVVRQYLFQRGMYRVTIAVNDLTLHFDLPERKTEGEVVRLHVEAESIG